MAEVMKLSGKDIKPAIIKMHKNLKKHFSTMRRKVEIIQKN